MTNEYIKGAEEMIYKFIEKLIDKIHSDRMRFHLYPTKCIEEIAESLRKDLYAEEHTGEN